MTTTPAPPAIGQDPWGEDLNTYLAYVESRVSTVEQQPNGAVMSFNFSPEPDTLARSGFAPGEVCFDSPDQLTATALLVSIVTSSGADARLALSSAVPGTILVLQQSGDVSQYAMATMGDDPVDMGDHFVLPLSNVRLASNPLFPGLTGLSAAGISQQQSTGRPAQGPEGVQGVPGEQGVQGEPGPQGAQGEPGPPGMSNGAFPLQWKTATTATNPAHGYIKANTADATTYTEIYVSSYDKSGQALVTINEMETGDEVYLYEAGQFSTWNRYTLTAPPVMNDVPVDWVTLQVVYVATGPQPFTPNGNTQILMTTPVHGEAGPAGPMGPQGVQGVAGSQGVQGVQGPQGAQGDVGIGQKGDKGDKGDPGAKGDPGVQGSQGATGAASTVPGPQGQKGDKGDKGDTGAVGAASTVPGPQGPVGPQGPAGVPAYPWTEVTTTTAGITPKAIATITIPASTTVMIEMVIAGRRTGGTAGNTDDGGSYIAWCTYKNLAGVATIIGNLSFANTDEDVASWDVTTSAAGNVVSINVIGANNTNVSWKARYRTYSVS